MKKIIGVIILNYISYKETINCIESFLKVKDVDYNVQYVIVDNCSKNDSYKILSEKYSKVNNIHVLKTESNIGFAKGNNFGCDYLREKYNCDYFIFSNSDILVPTNIFEWIDETYGKYNCDLLGPDIYANKLGIHQNPIKKYTLNKYVVILKIIKKHIELVLLKSKIIKEKLFVEKNNSHTNSSTSNVIYNVPIHGSFIITNQKIFEFCDEFFDSGTFLYMEEHLLYLRCVKFGLKSMVALDNTVIHLQGKSTDVDIDNEREKKISRIEKELDSLRVYYRRLNSKEKKGKK